MKGILEKERLLDIIRYFIFFQTDGEQIYKILAAYHWFYVIKKVVERTLEATAEESDGKIEV